MSITLSQSPSKALVTNRAASPDLFAEFEVYPDEVLQDIDNTEEKFKKDKEEMISLLFSRPKRARQAKPAGLERLLNSRGVARAVFQCISVTQTSRLLSISTSMYSFVNLGVAVPALRECRCSMRRSVDAAWRAYYSDLDKIHALPQPRRRGKQGFANAQPPQDPSLQRSSAAEIQRHARLQEVHNMQGELLLGCLPVLNIALLCAFCFSRSLALLHN
jgi:hypothetical protein